MAITCKYIEPIENPDKATAFLRDTLAPLLYAYWQKDGGDLYKAEMSFNIVPFIQMWLMNSLLLIIAYDNDKPVGVLIGVRFTPLLYKGRVLQVELVYGETQEVQAAMVNYLVSIVGFMDIKEIRAEVTLGLPWRCYQTMTTGFYHGA